MFNPHCKNDTCSIFWPICLRYGNQENNQRLMSLKNGGGGGGRGLGTVLWTKLMTKFGLNNGHAKEVSSQTIENLRCFVVQVLVFDIRQNR